MLVATDVAARGLDIADLPAVFNFDVPFNAEDYVHRIGRTGRAGASGLAVTLVSRDDARLVADIEKLLKKKIELEPLEFDEAPPPHFDRPHRPRRTEERVEAGEIVPAPVREREPTVRRCAPASGSAAERAIRSSTGPTSRAVGRAAGLGEGGGRRCAGDDVAADLSPNIKPKKQGRRAVRRRQAEPSRTERPACGVVGAQGAISPRLPTACGRAAGRSPSAKAASPAGACAGTPIHPDPLPARRRPPARRPRHDGCARRPAAPGVDRLLRVQPSASVSPQLTASRVVGCRWASRASSSAALR